MSDPYRFVSKASIVVKALARQVYTMTRQIAPTIWIGRGWDDNSTEHATGRALDIIVSKNVGSVPTAREKVAGDAVAAWLVKHATQLQIRHIIWNKKIWRRRRAGEGWRPLPGRSASSGVSDWHVDHIHVFLDSTTGSVPTAGLTGTTTAPAPKPVPPNTVSLAGLVNAARSDPARKDQVTTNWAAVKPVEDALVAEGLLDRRYADGHFGTVTRTAYKKWQERMGYKGADADGIPGMKSLQALANRHKFKITG